VSFRFKNNKIDKNTKKMACFYSFDILADCTEQGVLRTSKYISMLYFNVLEFDLTSFFLTLFLLFLFQDLDCDEDGLRPEGAVGGAVCHGGAAASVCEDLFSSTMANMNLVS
jgi:hypothetical protein